MLFAVDPAHRQFFHSHGWINFQEVLSSKECQEIWSSLVASPLTNPYAKKLNDRREADILYENGRDWHSKNLIGGKICLKLGSIAAGLWNQRPLILLADQIWNLPLPQVLSQSITSPKGSLVENLWSAQPIFGMLVVALGPSMDISEREPIPNEVDSSAISNSTPLVHCLPHRPGDAIFLKADQSVKLPSNSQHLKWWAIVFGSSNARYQPTFLDPLPTLFRQKGVPENGRLSLARLPIIAS
jgi:hypothetical protein